MSRLDEFESRDSGWRELAWAGGAATAIMALLVASVALVWTVGRGPGNSPVLNAPPQVTPTPRALAFSRPTPTPPAAQSTATTVVQPEAAPTATAVVQVEPTSNDTAALVIVSTPDLLAMTAAGEASNADRAPLFEATGAELSVLAGGSWTATGDALVNAGSNAAAEPWLPLAYVPLATVAVEAEIRVTGQLESVCDQSFGLASGSPGAGLVFGAGVLYPCSGGEPLARLTNVAAWENGYNADSPLGEETIAPGDGWHTYRFELNGGEARLLVDGSEVTSGKLDPSIDPAATDIEVGLWSQGVALEVRRIAVTPLPDG